MYARVTVFPGLAPERINATLEEFRATQLPILEQAPGFRGVWCGVDYTGGRAIAVSYWDTAEAVRESDELADQARAAAVTQAGVDRTRTPVTDRYEVVLHSEPADRSDA
jgi:heme-degrading monooxygenase HmoA